MMSQSLRYLEKRQGRPAASVDIVIFVSPEQRRIFYANGRTIIHCLTNVKRKMRTSSNCHADRRPRMGSARSGRGLVQQTAVALGGTAFERGSGFAEEMMLFGKQTTLLDTGGGLAKQRLRDGGGAARVSNAANLYFPDGGAVVDQQVVTEFDSVRGLGALTVELDLAALNRVSGQRTGLEKACGPEPFVDAGGVHSAVPGK